MVKQPQGVKGPGLPVAWDIPLKVLVVVLRGFIDITVNMNCLVLNVDLKLQSFK